MEKYNVPQSTDVIIQSEFYDNYEEIYSYFIHKGFKEIFR